MKNEKIPSNSKTTARKAVSQAITKTDKEKVKSAKKSAADFQEAIRLKAYELYVERGCTHGNDVDDWVAAERIVLQNLK